MVKGLRHIPSRVAVIAIIGSFFLFNGFNSVPVSAASDISVSNSGKVSFGKVSASSTGTLATGQDTLNITTDCEAGANVYATSVNGSSTGTSLINLAAKEQDPSGTSSASYTINTSSATIGSASALTNNTWGLNTNVMEAGNGSFYGLPEYSASGLPTVIYSGTNTELPIYYGAKVTNSLAPGTYTGEVLYTVTVNNSCLDYTVKFDKNASSAAGDMSDQSILPTGGTLSENSFTYSGYAFLGWSLDPTGKTGTAENGIGTAEDIDFADKASFPGSNESILPGSETTLYAIWEKQTLYMQDWASAPNFGCSKMQPNEIVVLTDSRDNHEYKVKKLPDGKCWMIQNLTLTATDLVTEGKALTSANTNIPSSDTNSYYITPKNARYTSTGSFNNSAVASASASVDFSSSYPNYIQIGYRDKNTTDNNTGNPVPEDTAYYSFYTATLGFSYRGDGKASGSSTMDICPKGWRLPKTTDSGTNVTTVGSTNDFTNLARTYNSGASWSGSATGTSGYGYYTSDSTIRQNMIKGDASSLDPELDTNGSAGFTYAGYYNSTTLYYVGAYGAYWSSSVYSSNGGYYLRFNTSNVNPQNFNDKNYGYAVRCVAQYSDVSGYMQDFDTNDLASGESTTLLDKRDSSEYTVRKFSDDSVWMTQNLRLGYDKGYALTSADTNISDDITYYLPRAGYRGNLDSSSITGSVTFDGNYDNQAQVQYRAAGDPGDKSSSGTLFQNTGYYNFYAATLGCSYYQSGSSCLSGYIQKDICPKGWQIPTGDTSTKSWYYFYNTLNGASYANMIDSTKAAFDHSGYYDWTSLYYVGSEGYWRSSTVYNADYSHTLYIGSGRVYPQNSGRKFDGMAVRCVAKDQYTINYNANGGTGEMTLSKGYIGGSTLSRNTFTKDGYYFLGWSTDPSATSPTYMDGATISTDLAPAGGSVTLYAVWTDTPYFQIGNICSTIPEGQTTTLVDSRDGQEYSVYHIPSNAVYPNTSTVADVAGKCIMTKDLNLGAVASVEGSASTITANGAMTLSPEDSNFTTPTGSGESITVPTTSVSITNSTGSWNTSTNSYSNKQYTTSGTGSYANRGYYSWGAAMTVCPKGWRLPTQDEYNNNNSSYNASTTGISKLVNNNISTIQSSPWSFVLGGYYNGSFSGAGSYGFYWSSAQNSSTNSYNLGLLSSNGLSRYSYSKYFGFSVRCIVD